MCLVKLSKEKLVEQPYYFKLITEDYEPLYYHFSGKKYVFNHWLKADYFSDTEYVDVFDGKGNKYVSGFHCFLSIMEAITYGGSMDIYSKNIAICQGRNVLAYGCDMYNIRVVVFEYVKLIGFAIKARYILEDFIDEGEFCHAKL